LKAAISKTARSPQFHFIGGKGGVGKTTCAAAFALAAASAGRRVLVASTDPAPSLGDALKMRLAGSPRSVGPRSASFKAVEIDAPAVLRRWIDQRRGLLGKIALEGTWLDTEDVDRLLALSLPGIDEVAALLEIARLAGSGRYDVVVVDTAPTGHMLRMLEMPVTLFGVAQVFDRMRDKHRMMVEALRGEWIPDAEDVLVEELAAQSRDLNDLLTDRTRTRFSWVTLPEPMAVAETQDALADLASRNIVADDIIVNRVTPVPDGRCGHCEARRAFEDDVVKDVARRSCVFVAARDQEPRGTRALMSIARELQRSTRFDTPRAKKHKSVRLRPWEARVHGRRVDAKDVIGDSTRLVMFGGKGGVGKTTCAAAAAAAFAQAHPGKRVELISTDPAHSLGDVLGAVIDDTLSPVKRAPRNLFVREMDARDVLERVRTKYADAINGLFDRIVSGGSFDIAHDRSVMLGLIDLAPPGLDELAAVVEITDSIADDAGERVAVIDTAPTGHALRLLEMPALIHGWTKALMAILLKYQRVTGLGELGMLLLNLSKGLGRLRELLADPNCTRFVVVTRPAVLPREESTRLLGHLRRLGINAPVVIANATGRGGCTRCRKAAGAERRELATFAREFARSDSSALIVAATRIPPPQNAGALADWLQSGWRYHQNA
jgi:arsenite-transporting ATPase